LIGSIVAFSSISPVLASSVINPVCVSLIEPFSYAYFAAGNISVGFTPICVHTNLREEELQDRIRCSPKLARFAFLKRFTGDGAGR
jgi:hypothetical protein